MELRTKAVFQDTNSIAAPEGPGDHGSEPVHRGGGSLTLELNVLAPLPLGNGRPCSQFLAWHPCNQVSGEELVTKWSEREKKRRRNKYFRNENYLSSHITVQENLFAKI